MVKRVAATVLWFYTVATACNFLALMSDLPSVIGLGIGAGAAAFVWVDPLRVLWSERAALRRESGVAMRRRARGGA